MNFERRIRRLVVVALALGGAAVVTGLVPSMQMSGHRSLATSLDGFSLVPILLASAYGVWLYGEPQKMRAFAWPIVTSGAYILSKLASAMSFADDGTPVVWTAHASERLILSMIVATVFAIPIAMFGERGKQPDEPSARVVS